MPSDHRTNRLLELLDAEGDVAVSIHSGSPVAGDRSTNSIPSKPASKRNADTNSNRSFGASEWNAAMALVGKQRWDVAIAIGPIGRRTERGDERT